MEDILGGTSSELLHGHRCHAVSTEIIEGLWPWAVEVTGCQRFGRSRRGHSNRVRPRGYGPPKPVSSVRRKPIGCEGESPGAR
jgi:hypothetical protein